jgi:hypothetical protein
MRCSIFVSMQARFLKFTINAGWESATTELPIFDARATPVVPVAHAMDRLTTFPSKRTASQGLGTAAH